MNAAEKVKIRFRFYLPGADGETPVSCYWIVTGDQGDSRTNATAETIRAAGLPIPITPTYGTWRALIGAKKLMIQSKGEQMANVNVEEVVIDGQTYVPKTSIPETSGEFFIVRTYSAGVFAGEIEKKDGKNVVMTNARRLWYWTGAASLSQLAVEGTSRPGECKFPVAVPRVELTEAIEILDVTIKAKKSIQGVKVWEA